MKKLAAFLLFLLAASCDGHYAAAQTTLPWGLAGSGTGTRNIQVRDASGTWVTVGTLDSTGHALASWVVQTATAGTLGIVDLSGTTLSIAAGGLSLNLGNANTWTATQTFPANSIALTKLATQAANTVVANFTGSTAAPTASTINGGVTCTNGLTYTNGTGFGCLGAAGGTVTSIASHDVTGVQPNPLTTTGNVYGVGAALASSFRLTLTTGVPVMTANVAAATSILLTPYNGNSIQMHDGTVGDYLVSCAEMSNVLANSATGSAGPAAVVASGVYDLFAWNSGTFASPVCTLTRGPAWTNSTTRSAGTALSRTAGVLRNSVTITNGPAANFGTYVGTFVADSGGGTVSWNTGTAASGGGAALLDVWNMYNRASVASNVTDTGTTYTYQSATIRQARASAGNQVAAVIGQQEDAATCTYIASSSTAAAQSGGAVALGIGINSTSTFSGSAAVMSEFVGGDAIASSATVTSQLAIGVNTLSANEQSQATTAATFDLAGTSNLNCGMRQ